MGDPCLFNDTTAVRWARSEAESMRWEQGDCRMHFRMPHTDPDPKLSEQLRREVRAADIIATKDLSAFKLYRETLRLVLREYHC